MPLSKPATPKSTPATPKAKADWAAASEEAKSEWDEFEPRFSIGRGQFGIVFLLQHPDWRKAVDKRVELSGMTEKQKDETEQEIELLKRLAHDNIVRYFHKFMTTDDKKDGAQTLHIIMEYCDSGSLADAVAEQQMMKQPFEMMKVRRWAHQLCTALAHIHSKRVIHRDVKTANVFLSDAAGRAVPDLKLGDFGISRLMSSQTNFASTAVGTPFYLSPELIAGSGYDGRAGARFATAALRCSAPRRKRPCSRATPRVRQTCGRSAASSSS